MTQQEHELEAKLKRLISIEQEVKSLLTLISQKDIIINKQEKELSLIKDQSGNERRSHEEQVSIWDKTERNYVKELSTLKQDFVKSQLEVTSLTTEVKRGVDIIQQLQNSITIEKKRTEGYKLQIIALEKEREFACTANLHLSAEATKLRRRFKWLLYLLWPNEPNE